MHAGLLVLPLWVEIIAIAVGAAQGAMYASNVMGNRLDLVGVVLIGTCTGVGGSFVRDVMLGVAPTPLSGNWYLTAATLSAVVGLVAERTLSRLGALLLVLDALTIGLFAAIGTTKALSLGCPIAPSLFIGAAAAVGGSVLRDSLLGMPAMLIQRGVLYASAAVAGASVLVGCVTAGTSTPVAVVACVGSTTVLRLAAVRFGWTLPIRRLANED